jgi:N-acetylglucosamine repressor
VKKVKTDLRGNRDLIKAMNRNLLLNILRRKGPLSRTQLTEVSGLSTGAVSQIITDLLDKNWIQELGEGDYTGGRRQVFVRINPAAGYAIGLKVMEDRVVCAVTDFESRVMHYDEQAFNTNHHPTTMSDTLALIIDTIITTSGIPRDQFFGIGIGLAGVVYPYEGVVHYSPFFGWQDVPLADLLQDRLNLPVYIENDVNTLTLSEHLFGAGRHQSSMVVVTVGRGIGMGMIVNGQLYQGARGGAGELGHIILDLPGAQAGQAEDGSLETLAADPGVIRALNARLGTARYETLADVVEAANAGNAAAREALARSGDYLGVGLAAVINILCPSMVIISGEGVTAGDYRLKPMLESMRRYTFNGLLDNLQILVEPTDDRTWARGAASLVMNRAYASPLVHTQTR